MTVYDEWDEEVGTALAAQIDAWTRRRVLRREKMWREQGHEVRESAYYFPLEGRRGEARG